MLRLISAAVCLLLPNVAHSATLANVDLSVGITLQTTPGQELLFNGGGAPAPSKTTTSGDATLTTSDYNGGTSCCSADQLIIGTDEVALGTASLAAEAAVNSVGSAFGQGERRMLLNIGNFGASDESISLIFDVDMMVSQSIDLLVGGGAASSGQIVIQRDGNTLFNHSIASSALNSIAGESFSTQYVYDFVLPPVDDVFTTFSFSLTGSVSASSDPNGVVLDVSAVPLPVSGLLLLFGCVGLCEARRYRA